MNDGASPARGNPACCRAGFRTPLPRSVGPGFVPRSGASCGAVTGTPIRKQVIDARFLGASLPQAVMPHGTVGSVTLPQPVGRVPMLANDANPAVGCRTDPWEPTPESTSDAGFSASRTPVQVPRADVTPVNVQETACTNRWGFDQSSTAVVLHHVGFTPAVNGTMLSLTQDSRGVLLSRCRADALLSGPESAPLAACEVAFTVSSISGRDSSRPKSAVAEPRLSTTEGPASRCPNGCVRRAARLDRDR